MPTTNTNPTAIRPIQTINPTTIPTTVIPTTNTTSNPTISPTNNYDITILLQFIYLLGVILVCIEFKIHTTRFITI